MIGIHINIVMVGVVLSQFYIIVFVIACIFYVTNIMLHVFYNEWVFDAFVVFLSGWCDVCVVVVGLLNVDFPISNHT